MRVIWLVLATACYTSSPPQAIANQAAPRSEGVLTISERAFGPVTAKTTATLTALRAAFAGFTVKPQNDSSLAYMVYLDQEELAWIIPSEDGMIFNIHAKSAKVATAGHDWRVGAVFKDSAKLTHCECWGENPTCFRRGSHVAVSFVRDCEGFESADREALRTLDGLRIRAVIWSPTPFEIDADDEEPHG